MLLYRQWNSHIRWNSRINQCAQTAEADIDEDEYCIPRNRDKFNRKIRQKETFEYRSTEYAVQEVLCARTVTAEVRARGAGTPESVAILRRQRLCRRRLRKGSRRSRRSRVWPPCSSGRSWRRETRSRPGRVPRVVDADVYALCSDSLH